VFCSDLIAKVYATHLRKIMVLGEYEDQVGALALATVAVSKSTSALNYILIPLGRAWADII